jgi:hypothetical protein
VVGFDVSGKTGTAQVVALDKAKGDLKDHAWFVAFAPRDNPEMAVVVLVENVGFGGTHSAPVAGAIFEAYYKKYHGVPEQVQVAEAAAVNETVESGEAGSAAAAPTATTGHTTDGTEAQPPSGLTGDSSGADSNVKPGNPPRSAETDVESPVPPSTAVKRRPKTVTQQEQPRQRGGANP